MKISLDWLSDFIEITEKNNQTIKEIITANTAEVETLEAQGELLRGITLAELEKLEPHPNADKLQLATVNDGTKKTRVVCGGSNLKEGMKIAFAHVGAIVKFGDDFVALKPVKIRDVESAGMICASPEIGLEEMFPLKQEKEVIDLSHIHAPLGTTIDKALGLDDVVIDIDNHAITNRWDLFSHQGFAREFVANRLGKWKKKPAFKIPENSAPPPVEYVLKDKDTGERYTAIYITNVTVKPSPQWMQKRLIAMGIRPISNLVDITNYVMMEIGRPFHAFDMDQIKGRTWTQRWSKKGEKVVTLDRQEHTLPEKVIVFEDGNEIFDLCGIMGGYQSGINAKTNKVWLHTPVYNKAGVRRASQALRHSSGASAIFEKGIDPDGAMEGLARAVELILESCPEAKIASRVLDVENYKKENLSLKLKREHMDRLIGYPVPAKNTERILTDLGFELKKEKDGWTVKVPSWRRGDVNLEADLIEEIARIYGYDNIPNELPQAYIRPPKQKPHRALNRQIKNELVQMGFDEIYTFSFLGPELLEKCGLRADENTLEVANPISADISLMRQSLLPRMLETVESNLRYQNTFRLFELSKVYEKKGNHPEERARLILAAVGEDFRGLQGALEHVGLQILPAKNPPSQCHPGRVAELAMRGQNIGTLYEVHPRILKNFDIKTRVTVAEVDLEKIHGMKLENHPKFTEIPKFPASVLDISIAIPRRDLAEKYLKAIQKTDKALIATVKLIDEYAGDNIEKDRRALTYSITYRAPDRTLTETEVAAVHSQVRANLLQAGAVIR